MYKEVHGLYVEMNGLGFSMKISISVVNLIFVANILSTNGQYLFPLFSISKSNVGLF